MSNGRMPTSKSRTAFGNTVAQLVGQLVFPRHTAQLHNFAYLLCSFSNETSTCSRHYKATLIATTQARWYPLGGKCSCFTRRRQAHDLAKGYALGMR